MRKATAIAFSGVSGVLLVVLWWVFGYHSPIPSVSETARVEAGPNIIVSPYIAAAQFSNDGKYLIIGHTIPVARDTSEDIHVWDLSRHKKVARASGLQRERCYAGFAGPNESLIVAADYESNIVVFNRESGKLVWKLSTPMERSLGLRASTDGQRLFTGYALLDANSGKMLHSVAHDKRFMILSPDARWAVLGDRSDVKCDLNLWNLRSESLVHVFPAAEGWWFPAAFSPTGNFLAISKATEPFTVDVRIVLWDTRARRVAAKLEGGPFKSIDRMSAMFTSDGRRVMLYSPVDKKIFMWNARTARLERTIPITTTERENIYFFQFSPDGRKALVGTSNGINAVCHYVWDLDSNDKVLLETIVGWHGD